MYLQKRQSLGWPGQRPLSADPFTGSMPDWMRSIPAEAGDPSMAALAARSRPAPSGPGFFDQLATLARGAGTQIGNLIGSAPQQQAVVPPAAVFPGAMAPSSSSPVLPLLLVSAAAIGAIVLLTKKKGG